MRWLSWAVAWPRVAGALALIQPRSGAVPGGTSEDRRIHLRLWPPSLSYGAMLGFSLGRPLAAVRVGHGPLRLSCQRLVLGTSWG